MTVARTIALLGALALVAASASCEDAAPRRPLGATCAVNSQCTQGVCGGGLCLSPEIDSDSDGLLNIIEAALGTDPVSADTDGDGKPDFLEVGDLDDPSDVDGDGDIDAVESSVADSDQDCIPDELDPRDDAPDGLDVVAELACCCDGLCSEVAPDVPILAECVPSGPELIDCGRTADCPIGLRCQAQPGRGACVPANVLIDEPPEPGGPCAVDGDCAAGEICESEDLSGTCVDATGSPPAPPPILTCMVDPMAGDDVVPPRLVPACDEAGDEG